jgi:hypothetical protein
MTQASNRTCRAQRALRSYQTTSSRRAVGRPQGSKGRHERPHDEGRDGARAGRHVARASQSLAVSQSPVRNDVLAVRTADAVADWLALYLGIKMLRRQMYGRAVVELLRARLLPSPSAIL